MAAGALIGAAAIAFGAFDGDSGGDKKCTVEISGKQMKIEDMNYSEVKSAINGSKIAIGNTADGTCLSALNDFGSGDSAPDMASYVSVADACTGATLQKAGSSCDAVNFSGLMPCRVALKDGVKQDMRNLTIAELSGNIGTNQAPTTDLVLVATDSTDVDNCTTTLNTANPPPGAIRAACANVSVTTNANPDTCRVEVNSLQGEK